MKCKKLTTSRTKPPKVDATQTPKIIMHEILISCSSAINTSPFLGTLRELISKPNTFVLNICYPNSYIFAI